MLGGARNPAGAGLPTLKSTEAQHNCAVYIAHFTDGYRVIYHMNGEWLLDSLEKRITYAHQKAVRCIKAMLTTHRCSSSSAKIYEITVAADLSEKLKQGLRNSRSEWQQYITHATEILSTCEQVNTASFISDTSPDHGKNQPPYLFVVSSDAFGSQHRIDTIKLKKHRPRFKASITHEVSHGEALYHTSDAQAVTAIHGRAANNKRSRTFMHAISHCFHGIVRPLKTVG